MEHIGYLAIFLGSLMEEEIAYLRCFSAYKTVRTNSCGFFKSGSIRCAFRDLKELEENQ